MSNNGKPLNRALAALNALLTQASAINLKEIGVGWPAADNHGVGHEIDILAHVEVFGRTHTVACQVSSGSGPEQARMALKQLCDQIVFLPGKVTPVLILPVLSPEVQALCEEGNTGCLDLHGNGRLAIDEIFVSIRSLPRRALHQAPSSSATAPRHSTTAHACKAGADESVLRGFSSVQATLPKGAAASSGQIRAR